MAEKVVIGNATLYHGDFREVLPLLPALGAVITDPPYGVNFCSGWTGASIAGDEDASVRDEALSLVGETPAVVFGSHHVAPPNGTRATVVWHRPGSGMGDLSLPWKPDFEMVFIVGKGFRHETRGSGVLSIAWDVFRGAADHPHQKPVSLMQHFVERAPRGGIADPFMGSGSTGVACARMGRQFYGIERERKYFDIACERISRAQAQGSLIPLEQTPVAVQQAMEL